MLLPNYREEFVLGMPLEESFRACQQAAVALSWRVTERSEAEGRLVCDQATSWTQPGRVEIRLYAGPPGPPSTEVFMDGSMNGFGPLVSHLLKVEVGKLRSRLELMAVEGTAQAAQTPGDFVSEVERLAQLRSQGFLTDEEFKQAKARLLNG